ncbi:MAG TPA: hypothetical protein VHJ82_05105 [Actinomycetota bacterium]|nr:hypothetical protein [Actinomycetota bacterium]
MDTEGPVLGSDSPAGRAGSSPRLLVATVVVLLLLCGTLAALLLVNADTTEDVDAYMATELATVEDRSRVIVQLLLNYDSTNLDQKAEEIRELATGAFREQYDELIGQGLGEALEAASASSRGQIIEGPDIAFKSSDEAIAIARVSQTAQSKSNPGGQTYLYVLKLNLIRTAGGQWLADRVEILGEEVPGSFPAA